MGDVNDSDNHEFEIEPTKQAKRSDVVKAPQGKWQDLVKEYLELAEDKETDTTARRSEITKDLLDRFEIYQRGWREYKNRREERER
jgi:hypothetical protein